MSYVFYNTLKTAITMVRKVMRRTRSTTESPAQSSVNVFRVALRVICITAVLQLPSTASSSAPSPNDDDWPGSVMTSALKSRPVSVTDGGDTPPPTVISPLPILWFSNVRDVTRSPRPLQTKSSRPKPIRFNNRKRKTTKTKKPKNKRTRNGKKKKIVLKNKIFVKLENRPKTEDSPPSSSPPTTAIEQVSKIVVQETVPQCAANDGGFVDVHRHVKSVVFQLAVTVCVLLVVVIAIYRYWTSWSRRLAPFHVLI